MSHSGKFDPGLDWGLIQEDCAWFDVLPTLIQDSPTLPLRIAAKCIEAEVPNMTNQLDRAFEKATKMRKREVDMSQLSDDEIAVVCWYTAQGASTATSMYRVVNQWLQEKRNKTAIKPILPLVKLLDDALVKLGRITEFQVSDVTLYRGVKWRFPSPAMANPKSHFLVGSIKLWPYFASFSMEESVVSGFAGTKGDRTVFQLSIPLGEVATKIEAFSELPEEREVLLRPLTRLVVTGVFDGRHTCSADVVLMKIDRHDITATIATATATTTAPPPSVSEQQLLESAKGGGAVGLVGCLIVHIGSEHMCKELCRMVIEACNDNVGNRVSIAAAGGIAAVLSCMRRHESSAAVCEQACAALNSLAWSNSDNQVSIAAAGGIAAVLSCMRRHESSAAVCEYACRALQNLAVNIDNVVSIAAAGGIAAVLSCMRRHESSAAVCEDACRALQNLAWNNSDNQVSIAAAGGIAAVLSCMGRHESSAAVCEQACSVLVNCIATRLCDFKVGWREIVNSVKNTHRGTKVEELCERLLRN